MVRKYPHLRNGNASAFPDIDSVNAYKFDNDFDYSRYDSMQMRLQLCNVPWDMGEAHIGNRTISGIGNVVHFGSVEKRNEYFARIPDTECLRFETKYKDLHKDNFIIVPVPFDIAARYNYIAVEYSSFANDESFVEFESNAGIKNWYWFVREVEMLAPNSTKLHVLPDVWQTFIYDLKIGSMMLERGHAPLFAMPADRYLQNPIENNSGLLTEDIYFQSSYIANSSSEFIFNSGDMKGVIFTTAKISGFGTMHSNSWRTPASDSYSLQGIRPAINAFCMNATDINQFIANVNSQIPQFMQTVKGVAFISSKLIDIGESFTLAGVKCNQIGSSYQTNSLIELNSESFGYDERYSHLAKLYTFPYAYIEVTDENGNITEIRIEDTNGKIDIESNFNLIFPYIRLNAHLSGIGRNPRRNIRFANVSTRNMPIHGNWYKTLQEWEIPTFGVIQDNQITNDYATHFDREQSRIAYENEYDSAIGIANANLANANSDAATETANASAQVAGNSAKNAANNACVNEIANNGASMSAAIGAVSAFTTGLMVNDELERDKATAAASAVGAIASGVTSGPAGLVSGVISAGVTAAQTQAGASFLSSQASANAGMNSQIGTLTNENTFANAASTTTRNSGVTAAENSVVSSIGANNAANLRTKGANTYSAETNQAENSRDTAQNAIANQIRQAGLNAPNEFGSFANGDTAATRPIGLFANIVTQPKDIVRQTADEFLRYGYSYNGIWEFNGNWCIGKHFTYWKLSDFWVTGLTIPDKYMDQLRFFLYGGVTIWSKPESIGNVTIYDN